MAETVYRQDDGQVVDADGLGPFVIGTKVGERTWWAPDLEHALQQHIDAFGQDPDEAIASARHATDEDLAATPGLTVLKRGI